MLKYWFSRRLRADARAGAQWQRLSAFAFAGVLASAAAAHADTTSSQDAAQKSAAPAPASKATAPKPNQQPVQHFDIDEYRVTGADLLPQIEVEEAVYPFLGPNRSAEDVEKARAALEKAYVSKGYQTVSVSIPQQNVRNHVVLLHVVEGKVGRLRVNNARYFDTDKIKGRAPSLAEGKVPNFNAVTQDIFALNQWADRKVTPALRAGVKPGTVDVDLNVEDKLPLHGSVEVNNRQSPNTTMLRVNGTIHYDNLWQRGDSLSFTYQVAPERVSDAEVFSASYLARTGIDWLNVLVYGVDSNSNVATVGGLDVVGPGQIIGARGVLTLPSRENFFETLSLGLDYKHFGESVGLATQGGFSTPVTYVPLVAAYSATWLGEGRQTAFNATVTANIRGIGSTTAEFDNKRYLATGGFVTLRSDISHTQELPGGLQLYGKIQGQLADQPLVSSEQFSGGGFDTVRGYLESETLGDIAGAGTIELRSPNIPDWVRATFKDEDGQPVSFTGLNSWRLFAFVDGASLLTLKALPETPSHYDLASYGFGTTFKLLDHANGMVAVAMPLISQAYTTAGDPRVLFRVWGEF